MISENIQEALNGQINAEMWSAYLYLSMSMQSADDGYHGMEHWFRKQYDEEMSHAFRLIDYMHSQMARVRLMHIAECQTEWNNPKEMFETSLKHERKVTVMIDSLYELAIAESDYATQVFLQWFINEQVEEEEAVMTILDSLEKANGDSVALLMLDKELNKR